jgi:hypothetical protein
MTTPSPKPGVIRMFPRRRMRRWVAGLTVIVAPAVALWGWGEYEERALARRVETLRAAGEPVTPADLASPAVPDRDNAAAAFRKASRTIDPKSAAWVALGDPAEKPRLPLSGEGRAVLLAVVAQNARALRQVGPAARMNGADWGIEFASPMIQTVLPDLPEQRALAQLLGIDGIVALDQGDPARALLRANQLLAQARAMDQFPQLLGHLMAGSFCTTAVHVTAEAARQVAAGDAPAPAVRERLAEFIGQLLKDREFREGLLRSVRAERVGHLDAITAVAEGRASFLEIAVNKPIRGDVHVQRALRGWVLRNGSASVDYMNELLAATDQTTDEAAFAARRAATANPIERSPRWYWITYLVTPSMDRVVRQHYRTLAARRMGATAIAVALYRADHAGRLPATLADLVPKYLPAVPGDPVAGGGKPLGYVADPAWPRVYSVGDNGVDDGGRPPDPEVPMSERFRSSDDVVDLQRRP